jgi:thymidylate kinase
MHQAATTVSGRRRLTTGGAVIALLGADGSGKSTLARELIDWLTPHLDTEAVYFGSGQGPVSWPRRLLERAARLVKRASRSARTSAQAPRGRERSRLRTLGELFWVSALALERSRRAARTRRARNRGLIVVCDRFPQSQFAGNEGPWLGHWRAHPSWVRRLVARRELEAIQAAERLRPDIVVRLMVTPEVALRRKSDTQPAALERKLDVLTRLRFEPESRVVDIDATRPLDEVVLELKRQVWAGL